MRTDGAFVLVPLPHSLGTVEAGAPQSIDPGEQSRTTARTDRAVLLRFRGTLLKGCESPKQFPWIAGSELADWEGVRLNDEGRVVGLELDFMAWNISPSGTNIVTLHRI